MFTTCQTRVIDPDHLDRSLSRHESQRELLTNAANAFGVATAHDLADYYRMNVRDAQPRLDELVTDRVIRPVQVEGWEGKGLPGLWSPPAAGNLMQHPVVAI